MVVSLSTTLSTPLLPPTTPAPPNTTSLEIPGGPNPPAVVFVQFEAVDQFVFAGEEPTFQTIVPGGAVIIATASDTAVVLDTLLPAAVMVSAKSPGGVLLAVVTFNVVEPAPLTLGGLKLPFAPVGNPLTPNVTTSLKPLVAMTLTV